MQEHLARRLLVVGRIGSLYLDHFSGLLDAEARALEVLSELWEERGVAKTYVQAAGVEEPLAPNEVASSRPERVGVAGRPKREEAAARASRSPTGAQCSTEAS